MAPLIHDALTMRRLFVAVDLPDEVQRRLARLVRAAPEGVRAVTPGKLHLTLHFLGDVAEESALRLAAALRAVRPAAFTIDLGGVGCFPSQRRPSVLWAGVQPSPPLTALHGAVGDVIEACGMPRENRPFTPHVTLARLTPRLPPRWTPEFLQRHADLLVPAIPVAAFILFESRRTDDGHEHVRLEMYPLGS
jgi:2'-5' RNA ligase